MKRVSNATTAQGLIVPSSGAPPMQQVAQSTASTGLGRPPPVAGTSNATAPQQRATVPTVAAPVLPSQLNVQVNLRPIFSPQLTSNLDDSQRRLLNAARQPPAQWGAFDCGTFGGNGSLVFSTVARGVSSISRPPVVDVFLTLQSSQVVAATLHADTGESVSAQADLLSGSQQPPAAWQGTVNMQATVPANLLQGLSAEQQSLVAGALGTPQAQWQQVRCNTYGADPSLEFSFVPAGPPVLTAQGPRPRGAVNVEATVRNQQIASVTVVDETTGETASAPVLPQTLQLFGQNITIAASAVANDPELNGILTGAGPRNNVLSTPQPNGGMAATFTTRSPNSNGPGPDDRAVTLHLARSPGNRYQVVGGSVDPLGAVASTTVPATSVPATSGTTVTTTTGPAQRSTAVQPTVTTAVAVQGGPRRAPLIRQGTTYPGANGSTVTISQAVIDRVLANRERVTSFQANGLMSAWSTLNPNRVQGDFVRDLVSAVTTAPSGVPRQVGRSTGVVSPRPWQVDVSMCGQNVSVLMMLTDQALTQCDDIQVIDNPANQTETIRKMRVHYIARHR